MVNVTLCGCIRLTDEQYEWDRCRRQVRRHYHSNPSCRERATSTWIWRQREPLDTERSEADEVRGV